ncbi:hypothetical protein [Streptomyces sp. 1114.5]|uniref:hypothetical protein n=1 Tax=Streptomyces sp. 1114.5 TaxID=1938830 RepID=UPI000EAE867E|nr:hypothetical protein [Streptomyces sp. 1114.5]
MPGALALLQDTEPGDPWEHAVTAVLTALCHPGDPRATDRAIGHSLAVEPDEGLAVFTTRLAPTALDAADPDTPAARNLLAHLTSRTGASGDGYALRDLLTHEGVRRRIDPIQGAALERALAACALGSAALPDVLRNRLEGALGQAQEVLNGSPFDPARPEEIRLGGTSEQPWAPDLSVTAGPQI